MERLAPWLKRRMVSMSTSDAKVAKTWGGGMNDRRHFFPAKPRPAWNEPNIDPILLCFFALAAWTALSFYIGYCLGISV